MTKSHHFSASIIWTGNQGKGTYKYSSYARDHDIVVPGKPVVSGSSDQIFKGNPSKHSPEDLLVASLASCHMLWYLHLCATNGVVVVAYTDQASGEMTENPDGSGQFAKVTLRPRVTVSEHTMMTKAKALHADAHKMCFIARSVNFPVEHLAEVVHEST